MSVVGGSGEPAFRLTSPVVGRENELEHLRSFVEGRMPASCLVLSGEPGIGKTVLWEAGIDLAHQAGYQTVSARASVAEAALTFVVLADLVDGIAEADLSSLPGPQLRALEVTLRRADPVGAPPDPLAVSTGFLNALDAARKRAPLVVAIDDVQWLDASSRGPLTYAARRLNGTVRFLLTRRPGGRAELERALLASGVENVEVEGMSVGAIGRVLADRLAVNLSRRSLRRIHDGTRGNPLFALELGRLLSDRDDRDVPDELPVPDLAEDVFKSRIEEATGPVNRVLLAVALSGSVSEPELASIFEQPALDDAVAFGLVERQGSRIHPAHPMLAAAARKLATPSDRRKLHLELASVTTDPILEALHLAVATVRPDTERAAVATTAAALAADRGRTLEAVQLAQHALRLTAKQDDDRGDRVLTLARLHSKVGDVRKVRELLLSEINDLPPGRYRALAHLLLYQGSPESVEELVEAALAEAGGERDVRAQAFALRSLQMSLRWVERIDDAARWADEALMAARSAGPDVEAQVRPALAWVRALKGRSVDDLTRSRGSQGGTFALSDEVARVQAIRLAFRGENRQAQARFDALRARAEERGELQTMVALQLQLCEVELRAGHVPEAARLVDDFEDLLDQTIVADGPRGYVARLRALLAAVKGDPSDAVRWGRLVLDDQLLPSGPVSPGWDKLEAERALGIAASLDGDSNRAVQHLQRVWDHNRREHVLDPGAFPVAGDLVDALVATERYQEARNVIEELTRLSLEQEHPWGLLTARRGESLLELTTSDIYVETAAARLEEAATGYGSLDLEFEMARSLLSLGMVQRRFKKWGAARSSLERAAEIFDDGGSPGWANRAREELKRLSGRRAGPPNELTPTETRVVRLAANGMSNKQIAAELFVTVNTVEGHLSRAYAKLGVSSRAQLTRFVGDAAET